MTDLDIYGLTHPPDGWYGPGHVYLGSLRKGRVAYLTGSGKRVKVVHQGEGSTTVQIRRPDKTFTTDDGAEVSFGTTGLTTLSRGTVVLPTANVSRETFDEGSA